MLEKPSTHQEPKTYISLSPELLGIETLACLGILGLQEVMEEISLEIRTQLHTFVGTGARVLDELPAIADNSGKQHTGDLERIQRQVISVLRDLSR